MKNFNKFKEAYKALLDAQRAMSAIPYWCITEAGGEIFRKQRLTSLKNITMAREILKGWLKENFPRTAADAYQSDQFSFKHFFEMLKTYPELAEENKEALQSLLCAMKATSLVSVELDKIPELSEFVK